MINSMFSGPTFSVIVSSYNYQDYVIDAAESALNQSYPPLEVIVVDDGSSDESQERLKARFYERSKSAVVNTVQPRSVSSVDCWF